MLKKELISYNKKLLEQNSDLIELVKNNFHILIEVEHDMARGNIHDLDLKIGLFYGMDSLPLPQKINSPNTLLLNGVLYEKVKDYNKEE